MVWPDREIETTISIIRGEHAIHYTTDAGILKLNIVSDSLWERNTIFWEICLLVTNYRYCRFYIRFYLCVYWIEYDQGIFISVRKGLCDKVCQSLATDRWFSPGTLVSSTNKTNRHDITEILLKVALNTIKQTSVFRFTFI